ncbi:MAG: E3 binding domain-containing protein, partial [Chloroflexi bacterium]|nr:E3 binding domain-containing protein [Chloroflexota bacterium]
MNITIELPHVGESVVEGTIGKWLKQPGDAVRRYDPLVEVITDKVTMEVPSPVNGTFLRVLAEEGETVPMGAPIAEMETTDVDPNAPPPQDTRPPATAQAQAGLQENVTRPAGDGGTGAYLVKDARPVGPTGSILGEGEAPGGAESAGAAPGGAARPSPAVRRLAREHGVDLARIKGTGLGGRITRDDLLLHIEAQQGAAPPSAAPVQDPIVPQPARE